MEKGKGEGKGNKIIPFLFSDVANHYKEYSVVDGKKLRAVYKLSLKTVWIKLSFLFMTINKNLFLKIIVNNFQKKEKNKKDILSILIILIRFVF